MRTSFLTIISAMALSTAAAAGGIGVPAFFPLSTRSWSSGATDWQRLEYAGNNVKLVVADFAS